MAAKHLNLFAPVIQEAKLKAARMNIYVRRGGPNYQRGLAKMRALGEELGVPIEVPFSTPLLHILKTILEQHKNSMPRILTLGSSNQISDKLRSLFLVLL